MTRSPFSRSVVRALTIAAAALAIALATTGSASALYSEHVLHSFCKWANCGDGKSPTFGVVADGAGNLYGTVAEGGKYGGGVAFKYVPSTGKYYVIKNFCAQPNCTDGQYPLGSLIVDTAGNLYGTASRGGQYGGGTVFELTHGSRGWTFRTLRNFCPSNDCTHSGGYPYGGLAYAGQTQGLPWDGSSPAYGVTWNGGAHSKGVVYQLCSNCFPVIHNFGGGYTPNVPLVDPNGTIYGTTQAGGQHGGGLMYKLTFGGPGWVTTELYAFCSSANCGDGTVPAGRLAIDQAGDLFGVTNKGGAHPCDGQGCGTVFERTANGTYTVLHNFCSSTGCSDGYRPAAGLILDSYNNLFGTTASGGTGSGGTAFELIAGSGWTERVRYDFCAPADCQNGSVPMSDLLLYGGKFFGTTYEGGAFLGGTIFSLTP